MKKITILIIAVLFTILAFKRDGGVIGKMFPAMECENYNGEKINLPLALKDKFTLLGMAFSNDAETDLKTWISPVYNKFIVKKDEKNTGARKFNL